MVKTVAPGHQMSTTLGGLVAEAGQTGLVLGRDRFGAPVQVRLFRPAPTVVTFIGDWWAARVMVFRCLGLGALVAVRADGRGLATPPQWTYLDGLAGGAGTRVWPMPDDPMVWRPTEVTRLLLHLYDVGPAGPTQRPAIAAWQTQLTVLARVTPQGTACIAGSDVVLSQRLDRAEAELVGAAQGLPPATVALLSNLDHDMVAACSRRGGLYAWMAPTTIERRVFGDPPHHHR